MPPTNTPPFTSLSVGPSATADNEMLPIGNLVSLCWRRKTTLLLCLLLGALSGILCWQRQGNLYRSSVQLLLIAGKSSAPNLSAKTLQDQLDAQVSQLTNSLIKERVISKALEHLQMPREQLHATCDDLEIYRSDNLLKLSLTASTPSASQRLLESIVESYQAHLKSTPQSNRREASEQLIANIRQLGTQLKENQQRHTLLLSSTPFAGTTRNIQQQLDDRLEKLENRRQELSIRKAELVRQLQSKRLVTDDASSATPNLDLTMLSQLEKAAARDMLTLQLKERVTASRARGKSTEVRRASQDAQQARQVYTQVGKQAALQTELSNLEESSAAIEQLLRTEQAQARKWQNTASEANRITNEINRLKEALRLSKKELQETTLAIELESCSLQVIVPAEPGTKSSLTETLGKTLSISVMAGILLGILLACWTEIRDQSFQNPDDIRRRLGVPLLGQLPFTKPTTHDKNKSSHSVADYQFSHSELAEQFRKIRTELSHELHNKNGNTLLITSHRRGEGRSFTAANLAAAVAQTGKKTLLIDADLQHPQLHSTFGTPQLGGLAALLVDNVAWQSTIQPTRLANLDLITSGQTYGVPTELLSSSRCAEFFQSARQAYDYIIVDAPPLSDNMDSLVIAQQVDCILLLLSVGDRNRSEAKQAFERLGSHSQKVAGVIMNNPKNRKLVWRTDPFEAYRWVHQSYSSQFRPEEIHATSTKAQPLRHDQLHQNIATKKPLVDYDAQELESLLNELRTEVRQVVTDSRPANRFASTRTLRK